MLKRTIIFFIFLITIPVLPWFVTAGLLLLCFIFIPNYFEGVIVAYYIDLLFSSGIGILFGLPFTFASLVTFIIINEIRKKMFIY